MKRPRLTPALPSVLTLAGLALVVASLWGWFDWRAGLCAAGVACWVFVAVTNFEERS